MGKQSQGILPTNFQQNLDDDENFEAEDMKKDFLLEEKHTSPVKSEVIQETHCLQNRNHESQYWQGNDDHQALHFDEMHEENTSTCDLEKSNYFEDEPETFAQVSDSDKICPYCKKEFKKMSSLKQHLPVHTKEKNFECNICNASYTRSSSLYAHMRQKHMSMGTQDFSDVLETSIGHIGFD